MKKFYNLGTRFEDDLSGVHTLVDWVLSCGGLKTGLEYKRKLRYT